MIGQDIISANRRMAQDAADSEHDAAVRALGLYGETGQRVRGTCPGVAGVCGVLVRWDSGTPVVRWDDGEEERIAAEHIERA